MWANVNYKYSHNKNHVHPEMLNGPMYIIYRHLKRLWSHIGLLIHVIKDILICLLWKIKKKNLYTTGEIHYKRIE